MPGTSPVTKRGGVLRRVLVAAIAGSVVAIAAPAAQAGSPAHRPKSLKTPRIAGAAVAGETLRASKGTWSRSSARRPRSYSFAWLSCRAGRRCAAIRHAHGRRYRVRSRDVGRRLRVRVTARRGPLRAVALSRRTGIVQAAAGPGGGPPPPGPSPSPSGGLHVAGNRLLDASGAAVQLHGINYSGTEYACIQGWGIFDGPSDDASVAAIRSWNSNVVHLGLNEDCILGINGVPAAYAGANYMNAIVTYVNRLHAHGMYAEVSLMWAAPGSQRAQDHPPILDADHSPAALRAIANAFKGDPSTIIGLQSEPHDIDWACWRNGGSSCSVGYTALGMQGALDAVRGTGATNVVTASGIDYANNLSQWLARKPVDPLGQLAAEAHVYGGTTCDTVSCLDSTMAPVVAQVPLIFGETGESYDASACSSTTHIARFLTWADAHGVGYEAWQWNPWGNCLDLTTDAFDGSVANNAYARYVHDHYATRP
jgi:hypothetical protein